MNTRVDTASMGFGLPLFLTHKNKTFWAIIFGIVAAILYLSSNHYPIFEPRMLPMSWIDNAVPFIPQTVFIYISEYIFFFAIYFNCQDMVNANKYLYSFIALQFISVMIFWAWPTTFPRDLFPLPADLDRVTHYVFSSLREADKPNNCCPSLHVSSVYLSTFIFLDDQKKKFPFFFTWGTAIAISTLTTKQHYLVDVVTGFMMAVVTYVIFHRYIPYRPVQPKR